MIVALRSQRQHLFKISTEEKIKQKYVTYYVIGNMELLKFDVEIIDSVVV